jgi:[protein-PII] uridylyltransferase
VLVRHHLLMSDTAQLRDLTLEKTIQDFTQVIDSPDLLNMLLLLTYADMEATGVLSPMKVRFLEDLFFRAEPVLSAGISPVADEERARRFRTRLSRRLSATNLSPEQIHEHTEGMPVSYLLNTGTDQMALHIRMMETLRSDGPVVEFENEPGSEITQMHLCTLERPEPGLLSQIAGVLYAHEVGVHGAQVFTRASRPAIALDTLWVDYHGRPIPPMKGLELEQDLVAVLQGMPVEELLERCRKQLPPAVPPGRVKLDNNLAESHSVLEIEADDQPGFLYRITRALASLGWNIHSARISTRGDRARDAFYITALDGSKLDEEESALIDLFLAEFSR